MTVSIQMCSPHMQTIDHKMGHPIRIECSPISKNDYNISHYVSPLDGAQCQYKPGERKFLLLFEQNAVAW